MKQIYLDNSATTKIDKKVLKAMRPFFEVEYGNASSKHSKGEKAKQALENSRKIIAKALKSKPSEIYFTSGGTESNNWAIKGLFWKNFPKKNHLITTQIEHDCTLKACKWLETQGAKVTYLKTDKKGLLDIKDLKKSLSKKTVLVSIIHANNEIGTIQNLQEIYKICKKKGVLLHLDACQSFTKIPVSSKNADLITINSHKIHGPKGVGALYIKEGIKIEPLLHGGGHEQNKRSGTENIPGIIGFAEAVKIAQKTDWKKIENLKNKLLKGILEKIPNSELNSPKENSLPNILNISFENAEGEAIGAYLENKGIYVSTGSACMSNRNESSHVLNAIGVPKDLRNSAIRFSLSKHTTEKEINQVLKILPGIIKKLRGLK